MSDRPIGYRPPGCPQAGQPATPFQVEATASGGLRAECPGCGQTLWLSRFFESDDPVAPVQWIFPEHIDRERERAEDEERERSPVIRAELHLYAPEVPPIFDADSPV